MGDLLPDSRAEARAPRIVWLWALVPLVAAASLAAGLRSERGVPDDSDWAAVVDGLGAARPGDAIWVNPTWMAAPWTALAEAAEGAGLAPGFLHAAPLTIADVARFRRVWVVGRRGDPLPDVLGPATTTVEAGPLSLAVAEVPVGPPVTDFLAALDRARVERVPDDGRALSCRWAGDRHRCDGRDWTAVRVVMAEVGNTRRRCVFAHPEPDRSTLRIAWRGVTVGGRIAGGVGLNLWANRKDEGGDVRFLIRVGGDVVHEDLLPRGDFTWHAFDVELPGPRGRTADVAIELSAESTAWRQTCFDAMAL